ncbi:MAG: DndE family protein [Gallionella sp.]
MSDISLENVLVSNFQTSAEADKITEMLKGKLGLSVRYRIARLAIGRSLGESTFPTQHVDAQGKTIKGDLLFGLDEYPLWVGMLITNIKAHNLKPELSIASLQIAVRRHWHRGIMLLLNDWKEAGEDPRKFWEILIHRRAMLPDTVAKQGKFSEMHHDGMGFSGMAKAVYVDLGKGVDAPHEQYKRLVNGVGTSPHMAIMGQSGSGKTRIMKEVLKQIHAQTSAPVILLDLGKGDLANDAALIDVLGAKILRVPEDGIPLDMFYDSNQNDEIATDAVMGFRDSFSSVIQSKLGPKQLDNLRESLKPLFSSQKKITLEQVRACLSQHYEENDLKVDSVISTINDLTQYKIFRPDFSPQQFFSQSWIITFAHAHDTIKNLAVFLLMDALNTYMKRSSEAPQDSEEHRAIRLVLAVDEARHLLASKHDALSDNIRLHRSKGLVVTLASQSPDDYDGKSDDYLENIGLPICFNTNAVATKVLQNMFRGKANFASLPSGVFMTLKEMKQVKIKAF